MPPEPACSSAIAKIAGLCQMAAARGVPAAKARQCLREPERGRRSWSQMTSEAAEQIPAFPGTPTFLVNGKMLATRRPGTTLEPQLKDALGELRLARAGATALRIRRLKLSGFKSFVEPAELRIEPGLTGVVGPNGCGKSNLLEAIRWAMGEASPKSLRGGGMDDVIFAGTATRPPRDFAEVSILLERDAGEDGGARRERGHPADRARRRLRLPDRRPRRARQGRRLLFADAATGAHSPALVSQGKIGAVIAAKPVERRLLLEEAAGISGLHARRKDAEQKLRATEANLARLGEILGDQEQRAAQLRRQARAAERYRKLTDQIRARRSAAAPRPLGRGRARRRGGDRRSAARRPKRSSAIQQAIAEAQAAQERGDAALGRAPQCARPSCASRATSSRISWRRRGRGATRSRGGSPSSTGSMRRSPPTSRARRRCKSDAGARRSPSSTRSARRSSGGSRMPKRMPARIAAELSSAEAASREAEAALAELLARQAAMRAERRVAEAALEAARAQLARTEQERRQARRAARGARRRQRAGARARRGRGEGRGRRRGAGASRSARGSRPSRAARRRPSSAMRPKASSPSARAALSAAQVRA